jgi:hypothetical protein
MICIEAPPVPLAVPATACHPRPIRRLAALLAVLSSLAAAGTAEARQLVRYDLSGGLKGANERLTVARDGTARQSGKRSGPSHYKVSAKELRGLRHDLRAAHFKSLKRRYAPRYIVSDGITQTVTYNGRSVSVSTGAKAPERLHRVLRRLGRLLARR